MRQRPAAMALLVLLAATVVVAQQTPVFTPFGALPVLDQYLEALRQQTGILVGDLSSTLAAVMLLECVERRQLYLADPVRKYGAELPEGEITLRDVLSHTNPRLEEPFTYSPERYAQLTPVMERCESRSYRKSIALLLDRTAMRDSVPIDIDRSSIAWRSRTGSTHATARIALNFRR
jgi:CubicO group peptidase (beta-lactamase class C family)